MANLSNGALIGVGLIVGLIIGIGVSVATGLPMKRVAGLILGVLAGWYAVSRRG
jgi:hypothetical protein